MAPNNSNFLRWERQILKFQTGQLNKISGSDLHGSRASWEQAVSAGRHKVNRERYKEETPKEG